MPLFTVLVIVVLMPIILGIGVFIEFRRMERRLSKKIEEVREVNIDDKRVDYKRIKEDLENKIQQLKKISEFLIELGNKLKQPEKVVFKGHPVRGAIQDYFIIDASDHPLFGIVNEDELMRRIEEIKRLKEKLGKTDQQSES